MTRAMIPKDKEKLAEKLLQFHAVPYRNRQSAAEEIVEIIYKEIVCPERRDSFWCGYNAAKNLVMKALN